VSRRMVTCSAREAAESAPTGQQATRTETMTTQPARGRAGKRWRFIFAPGFDYGRFGSRHVPGADANQRSGPGQMLLRLVVAVLTEEVVKTMRTSKLKAAAGVLVLVAGIGLGAGSVLWKYGPAAQAASPAEPEKRQA